MDKKDLNDILLGAAKEVFETMIFMDLARSDQPYDSTNEDSLLSTITFTGQMDGCFAMACSAKCAKTIAANMLGMDADDDLASDDICDAMGEVANMVMGSIKSGVQDVYNDIGVSIPSVISGRKLENSLGERAQRIAIAISIEEQHIAELSLLFRIHAGQSTGGEGKVYAGDTAAN